MAEDVQGAGELSIYNPSYTLRVFTRQCPAFVAIVEAHFFKVTRNIKDLLLFKYLLDGQTSS